MEIYYNFIHWAAEIVQQTVLVETFRDNIMLALCIVAFLSLFFGFYVYRLLAGALSLILTCVVSFKFLLPAWGMKECVTVCAVIGVPLMVASVMWFRVDAFSIPGLMIFSLIYPLAESAGWHIAACILIAAAGMLAGWALTKFFPFWSICAISSVWGAVGIAAEGWRIFPGIGSMSIPLGIILGILGFAAQLFIYRKQKLFAHIMPQKLEDKWDSYKNRRRPAL